VISNWTGAIDLVKTIYKIIILMILKFYCNNVSLFMFDNIVSFFLKSDNIVANNHTMVHADTYLVDLNLHAKY
jgi:hypothetical protein